MKLLLLLVSAALVSQSAHASKSRLASMSGARFLVDSQTIFINPAHVNKLGEYITVEFGGVNSTDSPKAEGGILLEKFGAKMGLYLGHMHVAQKTVRDSEGFYLEQNPIELVFGNGTWGTSVFYSDDNLRTTNKGQNTLGVRAGVAGQSYEAYVTVDLVGKSFRTLTNRFDTNFPSFNFGLEKKFDNLYGFIEVNRQDTTQDIESPLVKPRADVSLTEYEGGIQDLSLSNDSRTVYYGFSLRYSVLKKDISKKYSFTLPVVIGLEKSVSDWVTFRASLTQNVILGHTQDQTLTAPSNKKDTIANNTAGALGLSFLFQGMQLDATVEGSTSDGKVNGNQLLAAASLTYNL